MICVGAQSAHADNLVEDSKASLYAGRGAELGHCPDNMFAPLFHLMAAVRCGRGGDRRSKHILVFLRDDRDNRGVRRFLARNHGWARNNHSMDHAWRNCAIYDHRCKSYPARI